MHHVMTGLEQQSGSDHAYARARQQMVEHDLAGRDIKDARVLEAMQRVPRHKFVPDDALPVAYADMALPIGADQTISQPYVVAYMTQLLQPQPTDSVLEIGVGSGYQTAVLAEMVRSLIGIERIESLAQAAEQRLSALGYENVVIHVGVGTEGYPQHAPYDMILVAAVSPCIPEPLVEQLADGGRMVIPIGEGDEQFVERITRRGGSLHIEKLLPVRFVPLIGAHGQRR
jgi:protein-L-isoaspartate(D-aspartate) O-methyltransferase